MGAGHQAEAFAIVAQKYRVLQVDKKKTVSWPSSARLNERLGQPVDRVIEDGGKSSDNSAANGVCGKPRWCVDCLVATSCAGAGSGMAHRLRAVKSYPAQ